MWEYGILNNNVKWYCPVVHPTNVFYSQPIIDLFCSKIGTIQ